MSTVTAPFLVAALATIPALGQESSIGLEDVAFLELSSPRTTYFEHESFRLTLSFGLEREFLQAQVVQLFSRELDLPVQVDAPWLEELTGAVRRSSEEQDGTEPALTTFVLNGEIAEAEHGADRERNGRAFVVIELEGNMLAGQAGELVVPSGSLRFAYATRFEPDLFGTRVPADRQLAVVAGDPLRLSIEPLPLAGRPDGFTNAVGRFSVNASADPRALVVGGAKNGIHVRLTYANVAAMHRPRLATRPGSDRRGGAGPRRPAQIRAALTPRAFRSPHRRNERATPSGW